MHKFYLKCFKEIKTGFKTYNDNDYIISELPDKIYNDFGLKIIVFIENKHYKKLKSFLDIIKNKQITNCDDVICFVASCEPIVYLNEEELFYIKLKYGELFDE